MEGMSVELRVRLSAADVHYGGNLVDGAHGLELFGDIVTELAVRTDGDEGLFAGYEKVEFLAPLEVRRLPGVGPKSEQRLAQLGITTIGMLAALGDERMSDELSGKGWLELRDRARGIDPRPVSAEPGEAVSISSEETFDVDIDDREQLHVRLRAMAAPLAESLQRSDRCARTITAKLRYPDFSIVTRSHSLGVGTDDPGQSGEPG